MIGDRFNLLQAMGLTIVPVETLKREVALVRNLDVALVRADLSPERHDQALDWLIQEAARLSSSR